MKLLLMFVLGVTFGVSNSYLYVRHKTPSCSSIVHYEDYFVIGNIVFRGCLRD